MNDDKLADILNGFEHRRDQAMEMLRGTALQIAEKQPPLGPNRSLYTRAFSYSIIAFAFKSFWLNDQIKIANQALDEHNTYYLEHQKALKDRDSFYWPGDLICRLIEFFGENGSLARGRLAAETERNLKKLLWLFVKEDSRLDKADYKKSMTWHIWESENHHIQQFSFCWHISRLLCRDPAYRDRVYDDGHTPAQHCRAWTEYAIEWCRERARKGLFVEMANCGYGVHTLKGIYNFHDFTDNDQLRSITARLLDLYWATWAQEQIDGIRGGGKSRIYTNGMDRTGNHGLRRFWWFYAGMGEPVVPSHHVFTIVSSRYRPSPEVVDIALDRLGRGEYEIRQRRMGLAEKGFFECPDYRLRTDFGGILRYSWCTPEFIMGMPILEARPFEDWTLISSQNRWQGVIFRGHPDARIVPQPEVLTQRVAFNHQWGVQCRGSMIVQRMKEEYARDTGNMRIWISRSGLKSPVEKDNWVFVEADGAYAGIRPVIGGYTWKASEIDNLPGQWLCCENGFTPVIIEVVQKKNCADFDAFQSRLLEKDVFFSDSVLDWTGFSGDRLVFYIDYSRMPEINGAPIDLAPKYTFQSPFVTSEWNSGLVTIQKGSRNQVLDFRVEK